MATEFKLPELGEGVEKGKVVNVLVSKGDTISEEQPVIEIETDKASVEVPSEVSGKITDVQVEEGQELAVGSTILVVEESGGGKPEEQEAPDAGEEPAQEEQPAEEAAPEREEASPQEQQAPAREKTPSKQEAAPPAEDQQPAPAAKQEAPRESVQGRGPVPASPSVRRLAREIGVDIHRVTGSGPGGRITEQDVKEYSRQIHVDTGGASPRPIGPPPSGAPRSGLPDFSRWGEVDVEELSGIRKRTAENMAHSWATVPQVTQFDKADVTDVERLRKQYGKRVEKAGAKLTLTAIIVKILPAALKRFPQVNSSIDVDNDELIYKRYYHIGVAVDTDRGLLVPVIRDVDQKSISDIAVELGEMAERARTRKTSLDEMQGGTFTVSNLGGIGGTNFTPIVYSPQAAILGVARSATEPVWDADQRAFVPRLMMPVSLSYDHRIIDGADGARFLRYVCELLEQPFLAMLE